jgi:cyclase
LITGDMETKRNHGMAKVLEAIRLHNGTTILSTGITGDDARLAKAAVEAGAKMIEPNHPAVALARGLGGVTTMHAAEQIRHEVEMREMINVTRGVRAVVGREIYITVGIPGGFTELVPTEIPD